jgi:sugar/nucleoside kinase (ribokinase family)
MPRFDLTLAGELQLDLILYGLPDELPPERELLAEGMMLTLGGSSAIVVHNLAALGSRVGYISRIGDDPLGQVALDRLAAAGADVSKVRRPTRTTPRATKTGLTVILQRPAWRNMVTYLGATCELGFADLDLAFWRERYQLPAPEAQRPSASASTGSNSSARMVPHDVGNSSELAGTFRESRC